MVNRIYFVYSPAGQIDPLGCWLALHEGYMYIAPTLVEVARLCYAEWKHDRHLVG